MKLKKPKIYKLLRTARNLMYWLNIHSFYYSTTIFQSSYKLLLYLTGIFLFIGLPSLLMASLFLESPSLIIGALVTGTMYANIGLIYLTAIVYNLAFYSARASFTNLLYYYAEALISDKAMQYYPFSYFHSNAFINAVDNFLPIDKIFLEYYESAEDFIKSLNDEVKYYGASPIINNINMLPNRDIANFEKKLKYGLLFNDVVNDNFLNLKICKNTLQKDLSTINKDTLIKIPLDNLKTILDHPKELEEYFVLKNLPRENAIEKHKQIKYYWQTNWPERLAICKIDQTKTENKKDFKTLISNPNLAQIIGDYIQPNILTI